MEPETFIYLEDLKLEWLKEGFVNLDWSRRFAITIRISNQSDHLKFVSLHPEYISISKGLKDEVDMSHYMNYGQELLPESFVDVNISFKGITRTVVSDGDRIKLEIPRIATFFLKRDNSQWYFVECKKKLISSNEEIKNKIEQFEAIEENIGITLQNFSVQVKNEKSFDLYLETLITDEERCKNYPKIPLKLVIYDSDNNVIHMQGLNVYYNGFSIFQVLVFSVIMQENTLSTINKIRIYPSL